jgi:hypothetical protein
MSDNDTVPCPYCKAEIYEDSLRCPRCGNYISAEDAPSGPKPLWIAIGIIVCLVLVGLWIGLGRLM